MYVEGHGNVQHLHASVPRMCVSVCLCLCLCVCVCVSACLC